ncbi:hypothetical protein [Pseudomonas sp. P105]|nr:hypothetical protein [Pseudomonas sp. P105]WNZ79179.1 hypothetical protein QOM08_03540 [Pseudomonas sp. P105]
MYPFLKFLWCGLGLFKGADDQGGLNEVPMVRSEQKTVNSLIGHCVR